MKRNLLMLLVVGIITCLLLPQSVLATTTNLAATGEGTLTGGLYHGAGTFADINSDDGDTSYWYYNGSADRSWPFTTVSLPTGATVNSVTLYFKARWMPGYSGIATFIPFCYISGVKYMGDAVIPGDTYTLYNTGTKFTNNPSTGVAWTQADINSTQFGMTLYVSNTASYGALTYMYVVIDYTTHPLASISTLDASAFLCSTATLDGQIIDTYGVTADYYAFVWGTASQATPSSATAPAAAGYTANWTSSSGSYIAATYTHDITSLSLTTPYYFRFAVHNTNGWAWGDEYTFTTSGIPVIVTQPANNITATTVRLQSYLTAANGELCEVRFGWGTTNQGDNITAYDDFSIYDSGDYDSGASPYLDVTGLVASTTYYFNVEVSNICGSDTGASTSFSTSSSTGDPSGVTAIPSTTSIILSWTKGNGAPYTVIRYSINSCPADETSGTALYSSTEATYTHTALTSGTDYCYYIVGWDGAADYSTNHVVIHATTLAGTAAASVSDINKPPDVTPDVSAIENNIPLFTFTKADALSLGMPHGYFLFMVWLVVSGILAVVTYRRTHSFIGAAVAFIALCWFGYVIHITPLIVAGFLSIIMVGVAYYRSRSQGAA